MHENKMDDFLNYTAIENQQALMIIGRHFSYWNPP